MAKPAAKKAKVEPEAEKTKRNFGIGGAILPRKDLTRYVKWPKYVRLQRQRRVLYQRMKVPPAIAQFNKALDKATATSLFKFLVNYRPEDRKTKKERLQKIAQAKAAGNEVKLGDKPIVVKYGINHVTALIESKKAQLVVIAHDVDPIELVVFLPALCRKFDVPYCIVKSKSRLGQVVHKKTATALAITDVRGEDKQAFAQLTAAVRENFNDKYEDARRQWGGGIVGAKAQAVIIKKERLLAKEAAQRAAV